MDGKWKVRRDAPQTFDGIAHALWAVDMEWFGASGVRDHEEHTGQAKHMIGVHVREANGS